MYKLGYKWKPSNEVKNENDRANYVQQKNGVYIKFEIDIDICDIF